MIELDGTHVAYLQSPAGAVGLTAFAVLLLATAAWFKAWHSNPATITVADANYQPQLHWKVDLGHADTPANVAKCPKGSFLPKCLPLLRSAGSSPGSLEIRPQAIQHGSTIDDTPLLPRRTLTINSPFFDFAKTVSPVQSLNPDPDDTTTHDASQSPVSQNADQWQSTPSPVVPQVVTTVSSMPLPAPPPSPALGPPPNLMLDMKELLDHARQQRASSPRGNALYKGRTDARAVNVHVS